ncbi:outer membrane beta-barrel protein [Ramlibacter sp. AN1133]|uniref:outer membrane beta-barrel protein n=1 Tax=Ramlibacter sp. AN1133 TaxID=3133429 RepID=UPI0030BB1225
MSSSQRNGLVLILGMAAALAAVAQSNATLRWRSGASPLGLQPAGTAPAVQCGPFSLACDTTAIVPLYASRVAPRTVSMQVGTSDAAALRMARSQGLSLALVGKAGLFSDLGVYGRVGATLGRGSGFAAMPGSDTGMTYGVGLSWDFSRGASAMLGFDSYDVRGAGGDARDVRATSLGLQWRY